MERMVTLPSGNTVTFKDPDSLKVKDREKIITSGDKADGDAQSALAMQNTFLAVIIQEWSFDLVIPSVKIGSLGELSPRDYDAMAEQITDYRQVLFPALTETKESAENPDSPFDNSNDSVG